jgi:hypothetical protein
MVELRPHAHTACSPPEDVAPEQVRLLVILDWDGSPGTFVFGEVTEDGRGWPGFSGGDPQDGRLTIDPTRTPRHGIEWETWASAPCDERGLRDLLVELWPDAAVACQPPLDAGGLYLLAITDWAHRGTFVFGVTTEHGRASAGFSGGPVAVEGWLTIEPYPDTPAWIEWEVDGEPGRTDLSVYGNWGHFHCDPR